MLLLHYDACATVINGTAQTPKDVTQNPEIRSMLEGETCTLSTNFNASVQPSARTFDFLVLNFYLTLE